MLTQTFTAGEVRGLAASGVDVRVVSCRRPGAGSQDDGGPPVDYLEAPLGPRALVSLLGWMLRRPLRLLTILGELASARYRDEPLRCWARGFLQLLWGARLADRVRKESPRPHLHAQFVDAASTVAYVAARLAGTTFSVTNHTAYNPYLLRPKLRHAAVFLSISRFDRALTLRMGRTGRACPVEVVYQGIDVGAWGELGGRATGVRPRILSVAALREKKGHHVLIRALTSLPEAELTIVGEGPERPRLERLIGRLGLAARVTLAGAEPPDRVRERMAEADVFALACVRARNGDLDGVPISLMEAMAAGVPVVATRISGVPELVCDGEEGLLAPPGDPDAMAARIREVLADPTRARRMARNAREKVTRRRAAVCAGFPDGGTVTRGGPGLLSTRSP
ncbi:MAG: glycosyltransferase [Planctomycetota bacterium]